jgi:glycosyltransferase involved in cell wall biosynthesis
MKPIRVGQVTLTMGQGGIENLILSLTQVVKSESIIFRLYCLDAGGVLLDEAEKLGMQPRVFSRKPGLDWRLILSLAKAFRDDRLDVVHTHNQAAHFYGCLAAKVAGVPVIINTEHSRHYIQHHWRRRFEKRMLSNVTSTMVTVSNELCQLSIEKDGIASDKLVVIVNGVDISRFDGVQDETIKIFRLENGIPPTARILSIVARLHPIKNHSLILQAVKILTTVYPDIRLLIVGDGELRRNLEHLSSDLKIANNVSFLGNRMDVPVILKASDATVLCSLTEGLPLILLEAMAARTLIIVTNRANRSGLIKHGINGLVVGDQPQELANAVSMSINNRSNHFDMTAIAYDQIRAHYAIEETANNYKKLYIQGRV